ncbi:MAG: Zn-ribbon domain-containing OB-fold protein, partial [Gammaproteobacteria bacterium]
DWTAGAPGIAFQRCDACGHVWYFRREFCPACGKPDPQALASGGAGTVHATTLVHRAPSNEFRAIAPYRVVLVDLDEGFRMMGHGEASLAIGDRVGCAFRSVADRLLPYFERENE